MTGTAPQLPSNQQSPVGASRCDALLPRTNLDSDAAAATDVRRAAATNRKQQRGASHEVAAILSVGLMEDCPEVQTHTRRRAVVTATLAPDDEQTREAAPLATDWQ